MRSSGPGRLDLERGFAVHELDGGIEQLADIVNASPYFRDATVDAEQSVYGFHCGPDGIFGREYGITRGLCELAEECEVYAAIRDDIRAVALGTRHEECGDVRHHRRYADSTVLSHLFDLISRNTKVVQPLFGDLFTGAVLHRLLDVVAGTVGEQSVYPYADLILILLLELSLTVDCPA